MTLELGSLGHVGPIKFFQMMIQKLTLNARSYLLPNAFKWGKNLQVESLKTVESKLSLYLLNMVNVMRQ